MTAVELISLTNQVLFVGLFVAVLWRALRQPSPANWDTLLLFGSIATVVVVSRVAGAMGIGGQPIVTGLLLLFLDLAPFAMIRLVHDFSTTPRWVLPVGAVVFVAIGVLGFLTVAVAPAAIELVTIGWFLVVGGYAAIAFGRAATAARGITRRRMTAVAVGAVMFIGAIVIVLVDALSTSVSFGAFTQLIALAAAISFFLGFAPPSWVRRAWREPDLRNFLEHSIHLAGMTDERRAISELQTAVATAFGASGAAIGVAIEGRPALRYLSRDGEWVEHPDDAFIGGRAFTEQRRVVAIDAGMTDPENAPTYRRAAANTVIGAPINAEDRRIGVLTVYAERPPVFVEDDLWLLELLADQIAVLLEARTLSVVENELRSREDAARLKEEFLSAAAHDLRTPLTVVLGQAELLERRVARDPSAPVDAAGVSRLVREARRLRDLVSELLDAQRLEQGAAPMDRSPTDLRGVVDAVRRRLHDQGLDLKVTLPEAEIISSVDRSRIGQVLDNLVENAIKYTADGQLPEIQLSRADGELRLAVIDHGIGIPDAERERIFDRFYRASNVQSVTDTGIGLGLYICQRIVEGHGGRIGVEPTPGGGSTFVVTLPVMVEAPADTPANDPHWPMTAEATADA